MRELLDEGIVKGTHKGEILVTERRIGLESFLGKLVRLWRNRNVKPPIKVVGSLIEQVKDARITFMLHLEKQHNNRKLSLATKRAMKAVRGI